MSKEMGFVAFLGKNREALAVGLLGGLISGICVVLVSATIVRQVVKEAISRSGCASPYPVLESSVQQSPAGGMMSYADTETLNSANK